MAEAAIGGGVMGLRFASGGVFGSDWDAVLLVSSSPSYKVFQQIILIIFKI